MPQMPQNFNSNQNNLVVNIGAIPVAATNQRSFIIRALYFLIIGWWLSAFWIVLAYFLALTIIGLGAAQWMFLRVNGVLTLQRLN